MDTRPDKEFITLSEYARRKGKSRERVRQLADAGRLGPIFPRGERPQAGRLVWASQPWPEPLADGRPPREGRA